MKAQEQLEEEQKKRRQQDILLLLQHLASHEETTIKMVLDGLYDIGSVNLINQKFQGRFVNRRVKSIANFSKPLFRSVGFYWFKNNCPQLIADWLYSQVEFQAPDPEPAKVVVAELETAISGKSPAQIEDQRQEIHNLRTQVRRLTGILAITLLGSGILIGYLMQIEQNQLTQPIQDSGVLLQK